MRIINLDESGIKLITNDKYQAYITKEELPDFVKGKYTINNNILIFNQIQLPLSNEEISNLPITLEYLKSEILQES